MTDPRVAPCSHAAAKLAVERWHYSRMMPVGKLARFGIWERDEFVGVVLFGRGAAPTLGSAYGLTQTQCCELVRVALRRHDTPVSCIVAAALSQLGATNPGMRLVVSFADTAQGHVGTIYQAGNWVYLGAVDHQWYKVHGRMVHPKSLHSTYGKGGQSLPWLRNNVDRGAERVSMPPKHRYVMPLDRAMRRQVTKLAQPYPQSADQVSMGDVQPTGRKGQVRSLRSAPLAEASA